MVIKVGGNFAEDARNSGATSVAKGEIDVVEEANRGLGVDFAKGYERISTFKENQGTRTGMGGHKRINTNTSSHENQTLKKKLSSSISALTPS